MVLGARGELYENLRWVLLALKVGVICPVEMDGIGSCRDGWYSPL